MSPSNNSSPSEPWSIGKLSELIGAYIERLGPVWVEAEITQWGSSAGNVYGKLSDVSSQVDAQVSITIWRRMQEKIPDGLGPGDKVIAQVKPNWWIKGGALSMNVLEIRREGLGEILEKLEKLRQSLGQEGLFDSDRKKPIPVLPGVIGLITARSSDAEKDFITNATQRWPDVKILVEHAAVQGDRSADEVIQALERLDSNPVVEVIVITRGGGDFINLLPFSDEKLVRRVASSIVPIISAIGHEADRPLLDEVSDLRASTPTDAAKRVVPDVAVEKASINSLRDRSLSRVRSVVSQETENLENFRSRPSMSDPHIMLDSRGEELLRLVARGSDLSAMILERQNSELSRLSGSLRDLSPRNTLKRGYAIVRNRLGNIVLREGQVVSGEPIHVKLGSGELGARVD